MSLENLTFTALTALLFGAASLVLNLVLVISIWRLRSSVNASFRKVARDVNKLDTRTRRVLNE